ncbi:MAG: TetR/AcrR family transcriptional regulator [Clostridiales bacterium]|nr:TetR/AcrR family transcriptional regulator [Candidatus Blautia equi]
MLVRELRNPKTIFTRMCIGEAVLALLKETELKRLKILSVVKKAGVSRMTFYKYYTTPRSALKDYLQIVIAEYVEAIEKEDGDVHPFLSYEHILFALNFFDRYRTFFVTLKKQGLYSILIDSINEFVSIHMPITEELSVYKRYSYAGSLLNCFLMWEENGKQESAEDVAQAIYELYKAK